MQLMTLIPVLALLAGGTAFALLMGITSERLEQEREQQLGTKHAHAAVTPPAAAPRMTQGQRT